MPRKPKKPKKSKAPAAKEPKLTTTKERIEAFRKAYAETCNIVQAAKRSGIERWNHYKWMERYPKYAEEFSKAQKLAADVVEAECVRRSVEGVLEPVFYQGNICGHVRRYSDGLAQFLLRGLKPEIYGVQRTEVAGPSGAPIQAKIEIVFVKPGDTIDPDK